MDRTDDAIDADTVPQSTSVGTVEDVPVPQPDRGADSVMDNAAHVAEHHLQLEGTGDEVPQNLSPTDVAEVVMQIAAEAALRHLDPHDEDNPNPPEGYGDYIRSDKEIARDTGYIVHLIPNDLRCIAESPNWVEAAHIDSYMCCLRRIIKTQSSGVYDTNYALMSSSLFVLMVLHWNNTYAGKRFVPGNAIVPDSWLNFVQGQSDDERPWWTVEFVLLPCSINNGHWVLANICLKQGKVVVYDSLAKSTDSRKSRVTAMQALVSLLPILLVQSGYYEHLSKDAPAYKKWALEILDPGKVAVPQQPNGHSCGVYVMKYVMDILRHSEDQWVNNHSMGDMTSLRQKFAMFLYRHSSVVDS
ncbi:uncharacterized protein LOC127790513 [Diospyros lotus]|uniref:uncharacterized protein LOC127790513 n=1 Tax=Diospyros lotus TaxID=55363 RepID=UPI002255541D|nr:uncharacterized protein LOC127790513 [Diospyros lotus]XP_052176017.1 uncharacterized protein LOC127790513 [Diospyros lotus]